MQTNKFFSFEMILGNGKKFSGNAIRSYGSIQTEEDVQAVELMLKQSLNAGNVGYETHIEILTLKNWKSV